MYAPSCPADAVAADPAEMAGPGTFRSVDRDQPVEVHVEGRWQRARLTQWRQLPSGWVAHVRWRHDPNPAKGWAWIRYSPATLRPPASARNPAPVRPAP